MKIERIYWADLLRGLAIISMVVFHLFLFLDTLKIHEYNFHGGFFVPFGQFIRFSFFILVGFSLYISYKNRQPYRAYLKHQLLRGFKLFLIAMLVTLASYLAFPEVYVRFGVLHFISFGIIFGALFVRNTYFLLFLMALSVVLGSVFSQFLLHTPIFMPLGILYYNFSSLDYFPLFPYISIIFFGILFARGLDNLNYLVNPKWIPRLPWVEDIGKKALIIYLVHSPILVLGIMLLKMLKFIG